MLALHNNYISDFSYVFKSGNAQKTGIGFMFKQKKNQVHIRNKKYRIDTLSSFLLYIFSNGFFTLSLHNDRWHLSANEYSPLLAEGTFSIVPQFEQQTAFATMFSVPLF